MSSETQIEDAIMVAVRHGIKNYKAEIARLKAHIRELEKRLKAMEAKNG